MFKEHGYRSDKEFLDFMAHNLTEFCKQNPEYVPSSAEGHALPSLALILPVLYCYWVMLSRYYKSVAKDSTYQFDGTLSFISLPCCCRKWALEHVILQIIAPAVLSLDTLYHFLIYGKTFGTAALDVFTNVHTIFLYAWMLYSSIALLKRHSSIPIPENLPPLLIVCCFATATGLLYGHLVARCPYDTEMHRTFMVIPAAMTTLCSLAQLSNPSSFLLTAASLFWAFMLGLGFDAIAFFGFIFRLISPHWRDMPVSHKRQMLAPYFCVEFILVTAIFTLGFVLFGKLRGLRLGKDNPDYVCRGGAAGDVREPAGQYALLNNRDLDLGDIPMLGSYTDKYMAEQKVDP